MVEALRRNPLAPWYIGVVFLLFVDAVFFYYVATRSCEIPNPIIFGIMVIIPGLYLFLMYLAFRSQN